MNALQKRSVGLEQCAYSIFRDYLVSEDFEHIKELAWKHHPDKMEKISTEYKVETVEVLLDKLGIDFIVNYNGMRYAIDVTVGAKNLVRSKLMKLAAMKDFFDELDCVPVIVRSKRGVLPTDVLDTIEQCKTSYGVKDCRLNASLELVDTN